MQPLKAHVKDGRLVLDAPTDLPEGAEVELMVVRDDDYESEDRIRLLEAIESGAESIARGSFVEGLEFANELVAGREGQAR